MAQRSGSPNSSTEHGKVHRSPRTRGAVAVLPRASALVALREADPAVGVGKMLQHAMLHEDVVARRTSAVREGVVVHVVAFEKAVVELSDTRRGHVSGVGPSTPSLWSRRSGLQADQIRVQAGHDGVRRGAHALRFLTDKALGGRHEALAHLVVVVVGELVVHVKAVNGDAPASAECDDQPLEAGGRAGSVPSRRAQGRRTSHADLHDVVLEVHGTTALADGGGPPVGVHDERARVPRVGMDCGPSTDHETH
mmetsp:Transcript_7848/g.26667  ORF Transcript_7848/g.26667 Transcript_7848/m.26667 type:complete len:252 (+) Transcript_7848:209-964(+)